MGKNPGELTGYAETVDFHEEPTLATSHQTDKEETDTSPAKPGSELLTSPPLDRPIQRYSSSCLHRVQDLK